MGFILPAPDSPREHARLLMERKEAIQVELDAQFFILSTHQSTMQSPLVDREGFPRADIDVFAVRHARVRIIELRNDMKGVMDDIAKALEILHANPNPPGDVSGLGDLATDTTTSDADLRPFAKVDGVVPGSPAATAGLRREDIVLQFGHLTAADFPTSSLQPLAEMVAQYENRPLQVKVRRTEEVVKLDLTPRRGWGGRGLLGCHIVPYS